MHVRDVELNRTKKKQKKSKRKRKRWKEGQKKQLSMFLVSGTNKKKYTQILDVVAVALRTYLYTHISSCSMFYTFSYTLLFGFGLYHIRQRFGCSLHTHIIFFCVFRAFSLCLTTYWFYCFFFFFFFIFVSFSSLFFSVTSFVSCSRCCC